MGMKILIELFVSHSRKIVEVEDVSPPFSVMFGGALGHGLYFLF